MQNKKVNYIDITNKVLSENKKEYKVEEQQYFIDSKGNRYDVDCKHVIMQPSQREKEVANILGELYGERVMLIPRVNEPANIKTPDYIINNESYDLKEIKGNSKNTLYDALGKQRRQADNFIFDISQTEMNEIEAIEQIKNIYMSKNRKWVNRLILIKNKKILKVYKRD